MPNGTRQLVTAVSDHWNSPRARLQLWERTDSRSAWRPVLAQEIPVLLGRNGTAWGRGLTFPPTGSNAKKEGDGKAPAGMFRLGGVHGNDPQLPAGANLPYRQVTRWDAWVDDPRNQLYNQHVVVDPNNVPAWFQSQKMREGDPAYRWLLDIRHNRDRPIPGAGSAIFFHVRRGPNRFTSGCTTMAEANLAHMLRWLRREAQPVYVLLPREEYGRRRTEWNLP